MAVHGHMAEIRVRRFHDAAMATLFVFVVIVHPSRRQARHGSNYQRAGPSA
jgi:hypothetical protein